MKPINLLAPLTLGLILVLGAAGCSHPKTGITKLPETGTTGRTSNLGPGGALPGSGLGETPTGTPTGAPTGGIPQGPGHEGWIPDTATLQADTVIFAFDSSVVKPEQKPKVAAVADYLKANASNALKIEGHCDERGTEEYNRSLGERRALALREELVLLGVEASRVDTISFGKDRPADPGHDEAAWSKNRRGEFIVLTPPK